MKRHMEIYSTVGANVNTLLKCSIYSGYEQLYCIHKQLEIISHTTSKGDKGSLANNALM